MKKNKTEIRTLGCLKTTFHLMTKYSFFAWEKYSLRRRYDHITQMIKFTFCTLRGSSCYNVRWNANEVGGFISNVIHYCRVYKMIWFLIKRFNEFMMRSCSQDYYMKLSRLQAGCNVRDQCLNRLSKLNKYTFNRIHFMFWSKPKDEKQLTMT